MQPPKIAKVEAHHRTAILLHFTDGSVIELVAIGQELEAQQVVLIALWDLLRRAEGAEHRTP